MTRNVYSNTVTDLSQSVQTAREWIQCEQSQDTYYAAYATCWSQHERGKPRIKQLRGMLHAITNSQLFQTPSEKKLMKCFLFLRIHNHKRALYHDLEMLVSSLPRTSIHPTIIYRKCCKEKLKGPNCFFCFPTYQHSFRKGSQYPTTCTSFILRTASDSDASQRDVRCSAVGGVCSF